MELLANDSAHWWVLRHVLRFLSRSDVVRLAVQLLELQAQSLAHWLLRGNAWHENFDETECIDMAAVEGCWTAMRSLLKPRKRAPLQWLQTADRESPVEKTAIAPPSAFAALALLFAMRRPRGHLRYPLPVETIYAAARRGDLALVQHLAGIVKFCYDEATKQAAIARQLHVVQWLVDAATHLECDLRLSDSGSLEAICWSFSSVRHGWSSKSRARTWYNQTCYIATRVHGYGKLVGQETSVHSRAQFPLAAAFAAAGDLDALITILSLENPDQLFTKDAMVQAAANGHLHVVRWLLVTHPVPDIEWDVDAAVASATAGGHLAIIQWRYPEIDLLQVAVRAVETGSLQVLRWLKEQSLSTWLEHANRLLRAAICARKIETLVFLNVECGLYPNPPEVPMLPMLAVGQSAMLEYVVVHFGDVCSSERDALLHKVASHGTLEELAFLVTTRGWWSPDAFKLALDNPIDAVAMVRFLLDVSRERENAPNYFAGICLPQVVRSKPFKVATWLVENVPAVDAGSCGFFPSHHFDMYMRTHYRWNQDMRLMLQKNQSDPGLTALLVAVLKHRPKACRAISWLPQAAVRLGSPKIFGLLRSIQHPNLYTSVTRRTIVSYSRNPRFMAMLLVGDWDTIYSYQVTHWAAKYALLSLLKFVASCLQPRVQQDRIKFLRTAAYVAAAHSQLDVLEWIKCEACGMLNTSTANVFRGIAVSSVRYGHIRALAWFHQQNLEIAYDSGRIARQAAHFGQTECFLWACRHLDMVGVNIPVLQLKCAVGAGEVELTHDTKSRFSWQELAECPELLHRRSQNTHS